MPQTILYINPTAQIGGAEVNLIEICKGLHHHNLTPIVCCPDGPLKTPLTQLDIEIIIMPEKTLQHTAFPQILRLAWRLKKKLQEKEKEKVIGKIDIIHANSRFAMYISLYLGFLYRKKVILHWADYDIGKGDVQTIRLFKKNLHIIAVSDSIKAHLISHQVPKHLITTIHNGTSEPTPIKPIPLTFPKDKCILGITGRIDDWKGHRYALQALVALGTENYHLLILGEYHLALNPHLKEELSSFIAAHHLQDHVTFTGYQEDKSSYIATMDIILCPSDHEPFGLVAIEAMAHKKPIIASNVGGFKESIQHNQTGLLVPTQDSTALAHAIQTLYNEPEKRKIFAEAGYQRYISHFQNKTFVSNIATTYTKLEKRE